MERDAVQLATGCTNAAMIDWARMARPQGDGYDADTARSLADLLIADVDDDAPIIFDTVRVLPMPREASPGIINADVSHPNIKQAEQVLRLWPEVYRSFSRLMTTFHPLDTDGVERGRGSTCGSDDRYLGAMYATVYSVPGLAEAFVHEMGHTKLRYLGIWLEHAERLIANPPEATYESPIRKDKLRPMTAVVHAEYSYTYVTALDLLMYAAEPEDNGHRQAIEINYKRLLEGKQVIAENLITDAEGAAFFAGYFDWLNEVLTNCEAILATN